jgi:hypothetical protein
MVLAIAALLLHMGPAVPAMPAAAAVGASAARAAAAEPAPAPAPAIASLPDAPLPSKAAPGSGALPAEASSAPRTDAAQPQPVLRAAALDESGNDTQMFSTIRLPDSNAKPLQRISVDENHSRRNWIALTIADHSAATFDAYATRCAIQAGATEQDPVMRPFANSSGLYAAIQVAPLVLDFTARHMQRSENPMLRRTWWLPQTLSTGIFLFAGAHNLAITRH